MAAQKHIKLDIAILGGGFAGVYCAQHLERELSPAEGFQVGLISEENHMVFQPLLPEVMAASIAPRDVVNPLRLLCRATAVYKGNIESIDWPGRKLVLNAGDFTRRLEISYQHLVLALGAVVDLSRIPGMPEHAFLMRNIGDAMFVRSTILSRLEEANLEPRPEVKRRLLSFVVVGGGYSGVETAGHLADLLRSIHRFYPNIAAQELQVYLIHNREVLLPTLSRKLGEYTARKLQEHQVTLLLNQSVKSVTASQVVLADGSSLPTHTVISTIGNAPHPLVAQLCRQHAFQADRGRVVTDPTCRVKGETNLWAAGDCAAVPFVKGGQCPATAQFAFRQGRLVGGNLARALGGKSPRSFTYQGMGEMASIGHHRAVAEIFGLTCYGFFAWWLWRSVYLLKLPRLDRKLRVVLDWTLDLFFPRDLNVLNPRFTRQLKQMYLEPGDLLFCQGDPVFSFYIVKDGRIEIFDEQGVVQTVSEGEYFGERALLGDRQWHFSARAARPSVLVSIPAGTFAQLVQGSGSLGRLFRHSAAKYQSREMLAAIVRKLSPAARQLTAEEVMTRHPRVLHPDMPLREALAVIKHHSHSAYPVVDAEGRPQGVVSREDFYEFLKQSETTLATPVRQMPISVLPAVAPDTPLPQLLERLVRAGANKLLVTTPDARLQGIITMMDLVMMLHADSAPGAAEPPGALTAAAHAR